MAKKEVFKDVHIEWEGEEYIIAKDQVLPAICIIEEFFTIQDLISDMTSGKIKVGKLSCCVCAVLNFAGADLSEGEVFQGLYKGKETREQVTAVIRTLILMMIPPDELEGLETGGTTPGKPNRTSRRAAKSTARKKPSKPSTRRSSSKAS